MDYDLVFMLNCIIAVILQMVSYFYCIISEIYLLHFGILPIIVMGILIIDRIIVMDDRASIKENRMDISLMIISSVLAPVYILYMYLFIYIEDKIRW